MFRCNQCPKNFEDHSSIRRHLSIIHFTYSPYLCNICIKTEQFHLTATEEDMNEHFETVHPGTKPTITLSRDKVIEDKIKAVVEECRLPTSQSILRNFKNNLHNGSNAPSDRSPFLTLESRIKDLGRDSLTAESNLCAFDAPIFSLPELQSLNGAPTTSNDTQSQAQLNSVAVSNETFNQIDKENICQDSTAMPLPSVAENAFSNEPNTDQEFNEHDAIEPAIQMRLRSSSKISAANFNQGKRTLPMNDRHSRTKLSLTRSNPKKPNGTEKLHNCDHCSYASAKKSDVVRHMRTHTGEKPFKCEHCSFASAGSDNLNVHIRTHTGEKPFKCNLCSFASTRSTILNVHMRIHSGEKPYKCTECAYAGSSSSQLCVHVRRHHSKETE